MASVLVVRWISVSGGVSLGAREPCGEGHGAEADQRRSTLIATRHFDRSRVINVFHHQESMGTQSEPFHESCATSWVFRSGRDGEGSVTVGLVNSLGHWYRHSRFRQAHNRNCGTVILRPEIVQLTISSAFWLEHFGQVIPSSLPSKPGGTIALKG